MTTTRLPDAMPDIERPTLFVVCDTHRCLLIDAGKRSLVTEDLVHSPEHAFSDRQGRFQSPAAVSAGGGMISGTADSKQIELNRLRSFANVIARRVGDVVRSKGIEELFVSAPDKFLGILLEHLASDAAAHLQKTLKGNFVKEKPLAILLRFRSDLADSARLLREEEGYGRGKRPPA